MLLRLITLKLRSPVIAVTGMVRVISALVSAVALLAQDGSNFPEFTIRNIVGTKGKVLK